MKKVFEGFYHIYGHGGHLCHVTHMQQTNFRSSTHRDSTKNLALIGQAVLEKKMFEHCERRMDRRWTEGRRTMSIL